VFNLYIVFVFIEMLNSFIMRKKKLTKNIFLYHQNKIHALCIFKNIDTFRTKNKIFKLWKFYIVLFDAISNFHGKFNTYKLIQIQSFQLDFKKN